MDDKERLHGIVDGLARLAGTGVKVVFPMHPRTEAALDESGWLERLRTSGVRCCGPLGYLDFLSIEAAAGAILTDSGGVQEESTALGVSCFTLRTSTERPITITHGTNIVIGDDPRAIREVRPTGQPPVPCVVPLWDGHAGERIAAIVTRWLRVEDYAMEMS